MCWDVELALVRRHDHIACTVGNHLVGGIICIDAVAIALDPGFYSSFSLELCYRLSLSFSF
jgi:hypothetical protein